MNNGAFIISLDFELRWGAVEKWGEEETREKFLNTRLAVSAILELFYKYDIHATWATVGFLFARNKEEIMGFFPKILPAYENSSISSYSVFPDGVGSSEVTDKSHYAASIVNNIYESPSQELGSHTFSHYYTSELGQTIASFVEDLKSMKAISSNRGIKLSSLVFPRNQFNEEYLSVLHEHGINCVRSNPDTWVWRGSPFLNKHIFKYIKKLIRGFDLIIPMSDNLFSLSQVQTKYGVTCLPASRFLRPYRSSEGIFNRLKLIRIKREMKKAAKNMKGYHLWWHPHNFASDLDGNIAYLEEILKYYQFLNRRYGFQSMTMAEASSVV